MVALAKLAAVARQPRRWLKWLACGLLLAGVLAATERWMYGRQPIGPVEIFSGVSYTCERIEGQKDASGLCYLVQVDLRTPGIELYATPLDPQAVAEGQQYKLETAESVAGRERLAVCINGVLFSSASRWLRRSGQLARGSELIIADGTASQLDRNNFLVWFDRQRTPHIEPGRVPRDESLRAARWGIAGQVLVLKQGAPTRQGDQIIDRQTMLGIDSAKRLLWLAAFDRASSNAAAEVLARHGVQDAIRLDGGDSSTLYIGAGARGIRPGAALDSWRPSATFFGVRADVLPER